MTPSTGPSPHDILPNAKEAPAGETSAAPARKSSSTRALVEWLAIIGGALLAALVIKTFLFQAFYIPSESMLPTLEKQDRVLVNKVSYRLHKVNRGDVVVFERPPNEAGVIRDLIKRVVALPGETVEGKNGRVYIDGDVLREPYLPPTTTTGTFGPEKIPSGHVWVMGDNRSNSSDSRVFGSTPTSSIVGRAFVRVWPLNALRLL
ncbi:MAG: signal peptidase I [Actinobacteria bacterium]|nr:MAG: signal peptidase I [Actinomycetota bacterium]